MGFILFGGLYFCSGGQSIMPAARLRLVFKKSAIFLVPVRIIYTRFVIFYNTFFIGYFVPNRVKHFLQVKFIVNYRLEINYICRNVFHYQIWFWSTLWSLISIPFVISIIIWYIDPYTEQGRICGWSVMQSTTNNEGTFTTNKGMTTPRWPPYLESWRIIKSIW